VRRAAKTRRRGTAHCGGHKRKAELVTELVGSWEEAARFRKFVKAIDEETVRSDFPDAERNDIQQVVEWTKGVRRLLDPLLTDNATT
jgi:hypothetical protein